MYCSSHLKGAVGIWDVNAVFYEKSKEELSCLRHLAKNKSVKWDLNWCVDFSSMLFKYWGFHRVTHHTNGMKLMKKTLDHSNSTTRHLSLYTVAKDITCRSTFYNKRPKLAQCMDKSPSRHIKIVWIYSHHVLWCIFI